jgi:hypothetical protein
MLRSSVLRRLLSLPLLALVGCQGAIDGPPQALAIGGALPPGVLATDVRAEAEGWGEDPFVVLAPAVGIDVFSMTLPSTPPPETRWPADDLDALLCAGLDPAGVTTSRSPLEVALVDRLWHEGSGVLIPLTAASRPGIGFQSPSAFAVGDVVHRFLYVARSLTVTGSCSYGGGAVVHALDLALQAGWNALRSEITAVAGGNVQAYQTTVAPSATGLDWFTGEPVMAGVQLRRLPASRWHANGSWWGYHQTKLVRDGGTAFVAILDNDVAAGEPYEARVLRVDADVVDLARLPTSRPGQLLLAGGDLHAVVFEPGNMASDPSSGGLRSYAVARDGSGSTMAKIAPASNIRFGATVLSGGDGLVVWTESVGAQYGVRLRRAALGAPIAEWPEVALLPTDTNFQYPYVVSDGARALVAAVENEHEDDGLGNRYQQVLLWQAELGSSGAPEEVTAIDLRGHPLAASRRRLLEVSDLYLDGGGAAHLLVKTFDDPFDPTSASLAYRVKPDAASPWGPPTLLGYRCSWGRFLEVAGSAGPIVACSGYASLHLRTLDGSREIELRLPPRLVSPYVYVAAPRSGTAPDEPLVDLLLFAGTASSYPDGPAVLATVARAELGALLGD